MTGIELEIQSAYVRGWTFTPLDGKKPVLKDWPTLPRHTLNQLIDWARKSNVGLRTGAASGIGVIDIDPGAEKGWRAFPATVSVITGRGGWHLYYRVDRPLANSVGKLGKGIDVRGDAGQVVFVGGVHPVTQHRYWWMPGRAPEDIALAPFPWHLLPEAQTPAPPPAPRHAPVSILDDRAEERCMAYFATLDAAVSGAGGHNATFTAACVARRFGLDEPAMWRVMQWFNAHKCDPQWRTADIAHKIKQAISKVDSEGRAGEMLRDDRPNTNGESWPTPAPAPSLDELESF